MKRFGPSLYFASDKNIFDALNQRQVKTQLIRDLFLERGILVSPDTPKEMLAKYFSRLTADFYEHRRITERLGTASKRERNTSIELNEDISQKQIAEILQEIKNELSDEGDITHISNSSDKTYAEFQYSVVDYSKTELRQVQNRDAFMEFIKKPEGGVIIRSSQNDFADIIRKKIIGKLSKVIGKEIVPAEIGLEGFPNPKLRTQFFEHLIAGIDDVNFVTMTEAYCFKPNQKVKENQKKEEELDGEDEDSETSKPLEKLPYVERVNLKGHGVNRTFEIKNLYDNGFYIVKVVWRVQEKRSDGDVFEIEAQFSAPDSCTGFSYMLRSIIACEGGKILDKKRMPSKIEQDKLSMLIEKAGKQALAEITMSSQVKA